MSARPLAPGLLACLLLSLPAAARGGDDPAGTLAAIVPSDAYSLSYHGGDPSFDFMLMNTWRVFAAIREAGFDDLLLTTLEHAGTEPDEVAKLRKLRDTIGHVVGSVEWKALFESEAFYAESLQPALPRSLPFPYPSSLLGCRVEPDAVPGLERSLTGMLQFASKVLPDRLAFEQLSPPSTGNEGTRLYELSFAGEPAVSLAVRGDVLLFGLGCGPLFERSLSLLEGRGGARLLDQPRFRKAFDPADGPGATYAYMDIAAFVAGLRETLLDLPQMQYAPSFVGQIIDDVAALCACFETMAVTSHADGLDVVTETYVAFDEQQIAAGNPLYLSLVGSATTSGLLDFVPADATAFKLSPGRDYAPLYRWLRERLPRWVPDAQKGLFAFDFAQAAVGLDVERDLLACLGSASVTVAVPRRKPTPLMPEDAVTLFALRDKDAARRLLERAHLVWQVLERHVFDGPLGDELERNGLQIDVEEVSGSFPGLKRLSLRTQVPVPIEFVYGFVGGKYFVTSTSVEALEHVMATAAGEVDDYTRHPALQHSQRMPQGKVLAGSLTPHAAQLQQVRQAIQMAGGGVQMALAAEMAKEPRHQWVPRLVGDLTRGISVVLEAVDVREDGVCWRQVVDDGRLLYSRKTDRYKPPVQR